ncbi:SusC/RagA family TonB-linked outer membrane protein [Spirosoma endophyticum]|uniref:TonB-linked outer membrane protein, SusC/RagA family n=1 Tax=Spirosoma endophyticum TaxID=662367 RepID=A0A1I1QRV9_9BACT|nr:TonB-dependent receptor [Spirosoma endophyticum]SFD24789.1 TonB-linked outer membrane protein, SusC/RagA family [Spirosoma endophyticum]
MITPLRTLDLISSTVKLVCALLVGACTIDVCYADETTSKRGVLASLKIAPLENITGTVKDAKGEPLPGVNVLIKGTKTGTVTDIKGTFRLNLPTGKETLIFSYIGFKTKEFQANGQTTLAVQLEEDAAALSEVVVVGYGVQKKVSLTGAVATVDMKAVQDLPVNNLSAVLTGQLPGVGVSGGTSRPGENATITVRNPIILSKDGGTLQPLYVIDNVVRSADDFNALDVSEVEAISVLKDAAAAIYGARSNQGVVVVQTKRGKAGAPKFSYSGSTGISNATLPKMMNGFEQATYMNDLNYAAGKPATDPLIYTPDELAYFKNNNTDWLRTAWKPSTVSRHALNVSGGNEKATYFAGISYNAQDANFSNINTNKWTFRASADMQVTKGLKAALSLSSFIGDKRMYYLKQGGENAENDMKSLLYTPQSAPPYVNGLPVQLSTSSNTNTIDAFHFFEVQNSNNYTQTKSTGLNVTANMEYQIPGVKGLKARVLYSRTFDNSFGKQYGTKYNVYSFSMLGDHKHIYGGDLLKTVTLNNGDRVRINPSYIDTYQFNGYLNYDRQFGKHQLSAIAFFEQAETHSDQVAAMAEGVIIDGLDNMRYATGTQTTSETESETGFLSYAGRINYNYANKYLFETAIRYDASTNFAPEYRWGLFPSFSLGWVMSEERFFRDNVHFIDFLKLRGSLGFLGGDATKAYNWLTSYSIQQGKGAVFGGNADRPLVVTPNNSMANRQARWDDNTKYNIGLDAQFLKNRLSFTFDAFYDHRYNMLTALSSSVPLLVGATLPSENYATVNGFGTEISVGWNSKINNDWSYKINTFFTWSDNKQVLVDVNRGLIGTYLDPTGRSNDMGVLAYHYLGMFRTQQDVDQYIEKNPGYTLFGAAPKPGMLYYQDVRGPKDASGQYTAPDGKITDADLDYLKPKASNHYGFGFNFSTSYKNLSFAAVIGGSFGGQAMVEGTARAQGTLTANRPQFWADHWTPENPNAKYPSPYYKDTYTVDSEFWYRSATQIAVRNVNVSYGLPTKWAGKAGLNTARIYLVATNPLNLYNPYDYKANSGNYDAYPVLRSFSLGLNLGL